MMVAMVRRAAMTTSTATIEAQDSGPELTGRWIDALFGYGLLYLLSAPLVIWIGSSQGLAAWPTWFAVIVALGISIPHYGATILRVYEKRQDRRRYAFFTVWVTLLLVACFVASLYSVTLGSWLLTAYVCWSPWHFAGQNFGVSIMSLRRRGVPIDDVTRRLLHGSFALAYLLAMVAIETAGARGEIALGADLSSAYQVFRLGIPPDATRVAISILVPIYLVVTIAALLRLGRGGHARDLAPTAMLMSTHALWYVIPTITPTQIPLLYTAVWISAIHSLQYLWITTYYAKKTDATRSGVFFWKCLLLGSAVGVIPPLAFVPGLLGPFVPLAAEATIIFFPILNLHHFILDGAIWKLRDGRVARILLDQTGGGESESVEERTGRRFLLPAIYALGTVALALPLYYIIEVGRAVSSPSHGVVEAAAGRLEFMGHRNSDVYFVLGQHRNLADDVEGARAAYRTALEIDPEHADVAYRLASLLLDDPATANEALRLAEFASGASNHTNAAALIVLGRANLNLDRRDQARGAFQRALAVATQQGDAELAQISRQRLRRLGAARAPNR
jgi:hypothetical protein